MIKARATLGGRDTLLIGLSRTNIDRLLDGKPIQFDGAELGWPQFKVVVLAGETEADILDDLKSIGVATEAGAEHLKAHFQKPQ